MSSDWLTEEPFACANIFSYNGQHTWTAKILEGPKKISKIKVLTYNGEDSFSETKVSVSDRQCGSLGTDKTGEWQVFKCPGGTVGSQVTLQRN